jgi:hypothetical protein
MPRATSARAPKARLIPAWGDAPGTATPTPRGLKARPMCGSIPKVPFIAIDPIFLQKRPIFLLKRLLFVMRFLCIDVIDQSLQIRRPNGERTISSLPRELRERGRLYLEPFGRGRFELLYHLRHVRLAGQPNGYVNMVGGAADPVTVTSGVARDNGKIGIERGTNGIIEDRPAVLRAEDHMDEKERERLGHCRDYRPGFQPSSDIPTRTLGLRPRLV